MCRVFAVLQIKFTVFGGIIDWLDWPLVTDVLQEEIIVSVLRVNKEEYTENEGSKLL